mgnify:FL=1
MLFKPERYGAVKNSFAGYTYIADRRRKFGGLGRIERMAANAWDSDNVDIALETGIQSPQYVVGIKQINIVVYQDNVFQFRESREG